MIIPSMLCSLGDAKRAPAAPSRPAARISTFSLHNSRFVILGESDRARTPGVIHLWQSSRMWKGHQSKSQDTQSLLVFKL